MYLHSELFDLYGSSHTAVRRNQGYIFGDKTVVALRALEAGRIRSRSGQPPRRYEMAILSSLFTFLGAAPAAVAPSITAPGSMWHLLILKTFSFVADYGWRIVVFTVLLKLVLSPLDFYQRYKMNKNQKITERLKPTMEKLQKQYGGDKQTFSQKQMELNRKEGYSYFSSCLPMIVTMVIFITLWISMQTIAEYMTYKEYATMYDEYTYVTTQFYGVYPADHEERPGEPRTEDDSGLTDAQKIVVRKIGQEVVFQMYYYGLDESYAETVKNTVEEWKKQDELNKQNATEEKPYVQLVPDGFTFPEGFSVTRDGKHVDKVQADFLWIQNIWAPDVPWGDRAILDYSTFKNGIDDYDKADVNGISDGRVLSDMNSEKTYRNVMGKLLGDGTHSRTNGYLILPILVVVLSLGSQLLSSMQQKRAGQVNAKGGVATSMKVMMVIMPIMMAVFALQYASIFALYMVVNSATTLFFNFAFTGIIRLIDYRKRNRKYGISTGSARTYGSNSPIIHYVKGANPNAGAKEVAVAAEAPAMRGGIKGESAPKSKKDRKAQSAARPTVRGGRPDPNDLMGMDMSAKPNNKTNKRK